MCSCISPPVSLYRLLEEQNPDMLHMYMLAMESRNCIDILQAADAVSCCCHCFICLCYKALDTSRQYTAALLERKGSKLLL